MILVLLVLSKIDNEAVGILVGVDEVMDDDKYVGRVDGDRDGDSVFFCILLSLVFVVGSSYLSNKIVGARLGLVLLELVVSMVVALVVVLVIAVSLDMLEREMTGVGLRLTFIAFPDVILRVSGACCPVILMEGERISSNNGVSKIALDVFV